MLKKIFIPVIYYIRRWRSRPHMLLGCLLLAVVSDILLRPLRELIPEIGSRPEVTGFSLLWNNHIFSMLFFFTVVLFFCDIPFHDDMSPFFLIRIGRICFTAGHFIYIGLVSLLIPAVFLILETLMLPDTGGSEWGIFWGSIAQTPAWQISLKFDYNILWDYEPKEALLITFLICFFLCLFTGLVLYLFTLYRQKIPGLCILSVFIILPELCYHLNFTTFYWLSPYSWICLDTTKKTYNGSLPSTGYAFKILILLNLLCILWILIKAKCSSVNLESDTQ